MRITLEYESDNPSYHYNYALLINQQGGEQAASHLEQSLALDPGNHARRALENLRHDWIRTRKGVQYCGQSTWAGIFNEFSGNITEDFEPHHSLFCTDLFFDYLVDILEFIDYALSRNELNRVWKFGWIAEYYENFVGITHPEL